MFDNSPKRNWKLYLFRHDAKWRDYLERHMMDCTKLPIKSKELMFMQIRKARPDVTNEFLWEEFLHNLYWRKI